MANDQEKRLENTREELSYKKEILLSEEERIKKEHDTYSQSLSIIETLKEQLSLIKEKREFDRQVLDLNKNINKSILNTYKDYTNIKDVDKEILKISKLKSNIQKIIGEDSEKIRKEQSELLKEQEDSHEKIKKYKKNIKEWSDSQYISEKERSNLISDVQFKLGKEKTHYKELSSKLQNRNILTLKNFELLQKEQQELEYQKSIIKDVNKSLGVSGAILEGLSKIPGIGNILSEGIEEYKNELIEIKKNTGELPSLWSRVGDITGIVGSNMLNVFTDVSVIIGKIIHSFFELNKASVEFQRLTGDTANVWEANVHPSIISATDYMKELSNLTKQFGVNAQMAFDQINIIEMAEMTKMMGFTADGAGRLARLAQTSDQNLANMNEQIIDAVNNYNSANNVGINHRQILDDVSNASSAIALSLESSPGALAKAAAEARKLGIEMSSLEGIASSILDFESSIAAQLEAELLTGQQINLERARTYALTNDMEGLGKELNNNQQLFNSYVEGNRIQQESIARTLGMSREQMGEMIIQQGLYNDLSREQMERATGMSIEDMKRLEVQQSINQSIQKMTEALAGPLEIVAQMLDHTWAMAGVFGTIAGIITTKMVTGMVTYIGRMVVAVGLAKAEAIAKLTSASAMTLGIGIVGVLSGIAAGVAMLNSSMREADDLISPGYGKRTLTTPEGTYALNDKDTVVAGTDLGVEDAQIRKESSSPSKSPEINFNPLIEEIREMKGLLREVMERESDILMDGNKVGIALTSGTANYSIQ